MGGNQWILISSFIWLMGSVGLDCVRGQVSWTPIYVDTSNRLDLWTISSSGCECRDGKNSNCACCVKPGGCLCPTNTRKCAQCGLEDTCQKTCNVTISSRNVATRSGLSWVHLKSPELEGPTSCFWRLQSAPGQRIEVQIHRIISVGSFDNATQMCKDGFLQFADGDTITASSQAIQLCGQNSRFSPPVVLFGDQGIANLYLRIDGESSRSQVLAYVSFSSADDPTVGDPSKGGRLRPHSVCDWTYDNCWERECILSSPGFPGLFPPHRRCRYFLTGNATTDKILIRFQSLNIPLPPLCSSHHIAIWKGNVSNLAHLGPPWITLCQQSERFVEVEGDQALIEFRSGATTSPNLYNGFRASVEFHQARVVTTSYYPMKAIPTTDGSFVYKNGNASSQSPSRNLPPRLSESRRKSIGVEADNEELLGHARLPAENVRSQKLPAVSCGHIFDGNVIREESFRLKIPKDIPSSSGKKNLRGESLHANWNSKKTSNTLHCRLEFRGREGDILMLALSNYKLRGSNCSAQVHIHDVLEEIGENGNKVPLDRLSKKLCGPSSRGLTRFTSTFSKASLVVVLPPHEPATGHEVLEGAFRFHDESVEGTAQPESSCGFVYNGMSSPALGSLGALSSGLSTSSLLNLSPFPLICSYSFSPASNQSVLLTLLNATFGHDTYINTNSTECTTLCSTSGCSCSFNPLLSPRLQVDHLTIVVGSAQIACFCGSSLNLLPLVFESDKPVSVIYHYASPTSKAQLARYNVSYAFTPNKSRYTNFAIVPPNGWKRWREIITGQSVPLRGFNSYRVYDFTWPATIPIRLRLSIDLLSEENEQDCNAWNLTVWAENDKLLNETYLLASFCPAEGRKEVKVPDSVRNAFIKLQGVSIRVPQFEVRWKYLDTSLSTNRLSEKMMSDAADKLLIVQPLFLSSFFLKLILQTFRVQFHLN